MDDLAFEAAAAHFERALGSLELVDDASHATRCDLLLGARRRASPRGRRAPAHRGVRRRAAARAMGDADRLARAASGAGEHRCRRATRISVDDELVALLEEALAAPDRSRRPFARSCSRRSRWSCSGARRSSGAWRSRVRRSRWRGRRAIPRTRLRARAELGDDSTARGRGTSSSSRLHEGARGGRRRGRRRRSRCARCTATPCGSRRWWATGPRSSADSMPTPGSPTRCAAR